MFVSATKSMMFGVMLVLVIGLLVWLGQMPAAHDPSLLAVTQPATAHAPPLRIGLIPERDVFAQRKRYQSLADYLSRKLDRPVELSTTPSYQGMLKDLREGKVDCAFVGSLLAVLAVDRLDAQVLVRPETRSGSSTYRGVIIVPQDSTIRSIADLPGHSIAMVRTTTGGNLFPIYEMTRQQFLNGPDAPKIVWVGTHDDAILELLDRRADVAALKDIRLDDFEARHPDIRFRRLASSDPVPENSLVLRRDAAATLGPKLRDVLLNCAADPEAKSMLATMGIARFIPTDIGEYGPIYDMIEAMGPAWDRIGVDGAPPRRPTTAPVSR